MTEKITKQSLSKTLIITLAIFGLSIGAANAQGSLISIAGEDISFVQNSNFEMDGDIETLTEVSVILPNAITEIGVNDVLVLENYTFMAFESLDNMIGCLSAPLPNADYMLFVAEDFKEMIEIMFGVIVNNQTLPLNANSTTELYIAVLGLVNGDYNFYKVNINQTSNSIGDIDFDKISIYPNPVVDELIIRNDELSINSVEIVDFTGKTVKNQSSVVNSINVSSLSQGVYFLKMKTDKGVITKKFIKK